MHLGRPSSRMVVAAAAETESLDWLSRPCIQADLATYACVVRWCGNSRALLQSKRVHDRIIQCGLAQNLLLGSLLVQTYCKCGALQDAQAHFANMDQRNVFLWNYIIKSYSQRGQGREALQLFDKMQQGGVRPNKVTFVHILSACSSPAALPQGKMIHVYILVSGIKVDLFLGTALINTYAKCESLEDAGNIFERLSQRDVISWTAMIAAHARLGCVSDALQLFRCMRQEGKEADPVTFVCILDACASFSALTEGKWMHGHILDSLCESSLFVGNALVNMYGKCGSLDNAQRVFDRMPQHDVVSWNTMIAAYAQHGQGQKALNIFSQMQETEVVPNKVTCISVLDACARCAALVEGKHVHHYIVSSRHELDVASGTALVNMYGKCDNLESARRMFDNMLWRDIVSWNAMVAIYAQYGHGKEALHLFELMQRAGVIPDNTTFLSVLTACSHAGMIDDGRSFFSSMIQKHRVSPLLDHYVCMIDLLGRGGRLEDAERLINDMPIQPTAATYMALVGACRYQADFQRGELAAKHVFELDPGNIAPYVMLSNIYATAGMKDDVVNLMHRIRDKSLEKQPGYCQIDVHGRVHEFEADYHLYSLKEKIYSNLHTVSEQMEETGMDSVVVLCGLEEVTE